MPAGESIPPGSRHAMPTTATGETGVSTTKFNLFYDRLQDPDEMQRASMASKVDSPHMRPATSFLLDIRLQPPEHHANNLPSSGHLGKSTSAHRCKPLLGGKITPRRTISSPPPLSGP